MRLEIDYCMVLSPVLIETSDICYFQTTRNISSRSIYANNIGAHIKNIQQ